MLTWIEQELTERGWSVREFGRRIAVSPSHAHRVANGEVTPSFKLCNRIAGVLNMPPGRVFILAGLLPATIIGNDDGKKQEIEEYWPYLRPDDRATLATLARTFYEKRVEYKPNET